jgi:hypothetical protein
LGQRSRKRRSTGGTSAASADPRRTTGGTSAAIPDPRNSNPEDGVRRVPAGGESTAGGPPGAYARSRRRNEAARADLQPLAPNERPTAVTVAAAVAALIAVGNLVLVATGADVGGRQSVTGGLVFAAIMAVAAVFMWRGAYWAVLGFQALLGLSIITASLALLVASNVEAVIRSVAIIAAAGTLFWFLIRAMARLQMPRRTR